MVKSDFYTRFGVEIDAKEARRRFVNRLRNKIFGLANNDLILWEKWLTSLPDLFGELEDPGLLESDPAKYLDDYIRGDFNRALQVVERLWEVQPRASWDDHLINDIIDGSEASLGIRWELGKFYPQGDALLDKRLVTDSLDRLRERGHSTVTAPFEKALRHLLTGEKDSAILADAITDAYEALEAMAKVVTERHERDLSGNAELFLSKLGVSEEYQKLLGLYIDYANRFRHAPSANRPRPKIGYKEVESFIYMTGMFLRLASS
jgi:hypothetical protein